MDPYTALMIGSVAAPVVGGLIGREDAKGEREESARLTREGLARLEALQTPEYQYMNPVEFESYETLPGYSPNMMGEVMGPDSEMQGIPLDPVTRAAQYAALARMGQHSLGGLTAQDEYALSQIEGDQERIARGQREAIDDQFRRRGLHGSGLELVSKLQAEQDGAMLANDRQMAVNAQAQQRALQALESGSNMASNIRGQNFSEQERIAKAQDMINQFNTSHRRDVNAFNTQTANEAQLQNRDFQRQAMDQTNQNKMFNQYNRVQDNNNLKSQDFQNQYLRAGGTANQFNQMAGNSMGNAQMKQNMWSGIGQGVGKGLVTYGTNMPGDDDDDDKKRGG